MSYLLFALLATVGTWLLTALGSSTVFFFKQVNDKILNMMLGFAAGIMIAASFWSLLEPAIAQAGGILPPWLTVAFGFMAGGMFIVLCDRIIMRIQCRTCGRTSEKKKRIALLVSSITIHNIPEGLAIGVAFGALRAVPDPGISDWAAPFSIALGIGLQNFPEGAAVSIPLRREGYSRCKSFMIGQLSGIVEPIAGILGAVLVTLITPLLPVALSFAAGAMIFVVAQELLPEAHCKGSTIPSVGCILGFTLMMIMDVALG